MAAANDPLDNSLTEMDWLGQLNIKTGSLVDVKSLRQVPPSNVGQHKATASTVVPSSCVSSADVICDDLLSAISQRLHGRAGIAESDDVITRTQLMRTDKPAHSYTYLITCAISSTPTRKMALHDIYQWISDSYPYYKTAAPGWKNSVRHNLSLNKCFMKVARNKDDPGKGSYWALVDENQLKSRQKDVFSPGVGPNAVARLRLQQNLQGCGSDTAYCDRQYIVDGFSLTSVGDHLHRIPFGLHNGEVINDVSSSASFSGQSESFGGSWTNLPLVTATNVDELLAVSVPDGHQIEPNAVYVAHSICPQQPELLRSGLLANHLDHCTYVLRRTALNDIEHQLIRISREYRASEREISQ